MTQRDLMYRGFSNWDSFYWHLCLHAKEQDWSGLLSMYESLKTPQRRECIRYLGERIYKATLPDVSIEILRDAKDALETLKQISTIID